MKSFFGHVATAMACAALAFIVLFLLEAVIPYRGRFLLLGDDLTRILGFFLLTGVMAGAAYGVVVGAIGAASRRWSDAATRTGIHAALATATGGAMWLVRNEPISYLRLFWRSSDVVKLIPIILAAALVGVVLAAIVRRAPRVASVLPVLGGVFLVAAVLLSFAGSGHREPRVGKEASATGPNVVLIVLDALRADHVSAYGYNRPTSPNIDRMAEEGVLFENAYSHGNRTILAMPALFTSMYPSFHGAIGRGEQMRPLPSQHTTIAELFKEKGYATAALMTNIYLKSVFNMTQGFDDVEEFNAGCYRLSAYKALRKLGLVVQPDYAVTGSPEADVVADRAIRWIDKLKDKPFFFYVHFMDTHHPYTPPQEFVAPFSKSSEAANANALFRDTVTRLSAGTTRELSNDDLQALLDYYDGTIRFADHEIGRILAALREAGTERETIVVVTSDHGDEFLEHGTLYHNNLLIEELLRIPLVFWSSSGFQRGHRAKEIARHVDVLPTLADLIGTDTPADAMGRSLLPALRGEEMEQEETYAEGDFCTTLVRERWKVMYVDSTDQTLLFDLHSEDGEHVDVSHLYPQTYAEMEAALDSFMRSAAQTSQRMSRFEADPETLDQLRKLGYIK